MDTPYNIKKQHAAINLAQIETSSEFWLRDKHRNTLHRDALMKAIKNRKKPLGRLLLWQDRQTPDKFIVLDGHYRLMAYKAVGWERKVPVEIVICDKRTALTLAVEGNNKTNLPWTGWERLDVAWRLVREPVEPRFSTNDTVMLSGVSRTTVQTMRRRLKHLNANEQEITGNWRKDRNELNHKDEDLMSMSDAKRKREITKLAEEIRETLDRRKRKDKAILRDSHAVAEALQEALGDHNFKSIVGYLYGCEDEDMEPWMDYPVTDVDLDNCPF